MKERTFITTMILLALALMAALANIGQAGENEQLQNYYKDYILKCILKNQSKASLQNSKSANLRSYGARSRQKVVFLANNQNMLVNEMIKNKIGTKPYRVEYYLNKRFHEKIRYISSNLNFY
jgi:hypothetical protein